MGDPPPGHREYKARTEFGEIRVYARSLREARLKVTAYLDALEDRKRLKQGALRWVR